MNGSAIVFVVVAVVLVVVGLPLASYNRFVRQRNLIRDSWSNVDTELRRRYDIIPNLVATVKAYAAHEQRLFEDVTRARANAIAMTGDAQAQAHPENELVAGVRGLLAVAERYPDLKASTNFLDLQRELANTEDRIQAARRFYNNNVRDYNIRVESFPSNVIARSGGFTAMPYFEIEEAVRAAPVVET